MTRWHWRFELALTCCSCSAVANFGELPPPPPEPEDSRAACTDRRDNDRDENIDCDDSECAPFCPEQGIRRCTDGIDNDASPRGAFDQYQASCWPSLAGWSERTPNPIWEGPTEVLAASRSREGAVCVLGARTNSTSIRLAYDPVDHSAWPPQAETPVRVLSSWSMDVRGPSVLSKSESQLPVAPSQWHAAAITWVDERDRFEAIIVRDAPAAFDVRRREATVVTSADCRTWTVEQTPNLKEPYRSGTPMYLGVTDGGLLRLEVVRGPQRDIWIRPRGAVISLAPRGRIYRAYSPPDRLFQFAESELNGERAVFETLPAVGPLSTQPRGTRGFPMRVHQVIPDLGATAYLVTEYDRVSIFWSDSSGATPGLADERSVARRARELARASTDSGAFDSAHVEAQAAIFDVHSQAPGLPMEGWLFFRGFEEESMRNGRVHLSGGEVGLVYWTVEPSEP